jgi:short-subunit dehydrogenase
VNVASELDKEYCHILNKMKEVIMMKMVLLKICDLSNAESVRALVADLYSSGQSVHSVVANAGVLLSERVVGDDTLPGSQAAASSSQ